MKQYYVYITTNPGKSTLYTGITSNLRRRLIEHFQSRGSKKAFAGKYYCHKLLYFEMFDKPEDAIYREKEIKNMNRQKKEKLIATKNPNWYFIDIY